VKLPSRGSTKSSEVDCLSAIHGLSRPGTPSWPRRSCRRNRAWRSPRENASLRSRNSGSFAARSPLHMVDRRPSTRRAATPTIHESFGALGLVPISQSAKMTLAHPQPFGRRLSRHLAWPVKPDRPYDPSHSRPGMHAIPPAETGQIVCYRTRTNRVLSTMPTRRVDHAGNST